MSLGRDLTIALLFFGVAVSGCVTPVPGASQVVITHKAADVASCTVVGNIPHSTMSNMSLTQVNNAAVGLHANTVLSTSTGGIAYRCDNKGSQ